MLILSQFVRLRAGRLGGLVSSEVFGLRLNIKTFLTQYVNRSRCGE
jgi:hypothetical protein